MNEGEAEAPFVEHVDALLKAWADLTVFPPAASERAKTGRWISEVAIPQRAYLLFDHWDDNALAQALDENFPKWARDRIAVPDEFFEEDEGLAPFLLELPQSLIIPDPDAQPRALRTWLAWCLHQASQQMHARLRAQAFCGVIISPVDEQAITRHWLDLGAQRPPAQAERVLFRYQDPRVMQRVWRMLSPEQQTRWLGPVTHWWSLTHPWGPYSDQPETPQWFKAKAPRLAHGSPVTAPATDLFDSEQWWAAGLTPDANRVWRSYARQRIPAATQPDPSSMAQMLADATGMGFSASNTEDYVWATWVHAPREGDPHAMNWRLPHLAPILEQIQQHLSRRPDDSFATLLNSIIQSQR